MRRIFTGLAVLCLLFNLDLIPISAQNNPSGNVEEGKKVWEKWTEAMGGRVRLSKIKEIQSSCDIKIIPNGLNVAVHIYKKGPEKIRIDQKIMGRTITRVLNGEKGWMTDPNTLSITDLSKEVRNDLSFQVTELEVQLNPEKYNHTVTYEGRVSVENKEYISLKQTSKEGRVVTHYIDPDTYLRYKSIMMHNNVSVEVIESDYREVEGTKVPFSMKIIQNGVDYALVSFTEYKYNSNLDDSLFERPSKTESAKNCIWTATGKWAGPELIVLDEAMEKFMKDRDISAGALAVTYKGRLMLAKGYSWAGEKEEPVKPESLFRIASVSKPITAVAILHLVEKSKLRLDEKIVDVLDLSPVKGKVMDGRLKNVTILHLLQHLGGWDRAKSYDPMFQDVRFASELGIKLPIGTADIIRFMNGEPMQYNPGTTYAYSNYGYCLLGRVIERRSGLKYEDYVRKEILSPLGIHSMQIGRSLQEERAEGEVKYEGVFPYGMFRLENLDAHGGWIASAVDLARFASALDDPNKCPVLSAASIERMFALPENIKAEDYKRGDAYYACGWSVRDYGNGSRNTWHGGSLPGTHTFLARWQSGINCVVLFNKRGNGFGLIDPVMVQATHSIKKWPEGDLFY